MLNILALLRVHVGILLELGFYMLTIGLDPCPADQFAPGVTDHW